MPKLQVVNTLEEKRKDIVAYIEQLERDLEQARRELSAVAAAITVFKADSPSLKPYMNMTRIFPRGEMSKLCRAYFEANPGGADTHQLADYVIAEKGLDTHDRHLRSSIAFKIVQLMRSWERRGVVGRLGKNGALIVWKIKQ